MFFKSSWCIENGLYISDLKNRYIFINYNQLYDCDGVFFLKKGYKPRKLLQCNHSVVRIWIRRYWENNKIEDIDCCQLPGF